MLRHSILSFIIFVLLIIFSLFLPLRFWLSFLAHPSVVHLSHLSGNIFAGTADVDVAQQSDVALTDIPDHPVTLLHTLSWHFTGFTTHHPFLSWTIAAQELTSPAPIQVSWQQSALHITPLTWHIPLHALSPLNHWLHAVRLSGDTEWSSHGITIHRGYVQGDIDAQLIMVGSRMIPMMSLGTYTIHLHLVQGKGPFQVRTISGPLPLSGTGQLRLRPLAISFNGQIDIHGHPGLFRPLLVLAGVHPERHLQGPIPLHFVFNSLSR